MKKVINVTEVVTKTLKRMGYRVLQPRHNNANGPDLTVILNSTALTVEIKKIRVTKRNSYQVPPIERNRATDNLIAIVMPSGYVLIEPMKDHLKLCTKKGYRTLVGII